MNIHLSGRTKLRHLFVNNYSDSNYLFFLFKSVNRNSTYCYITSHVLYSEKQYLIPIHVYSNININTAIPILLLFDYHIY